MNFTQRCIISNFVWLLAILVSEMVTITQGGVLASYGTDFFLPYIVLCKNDAYLHIIPAFTDSTSISLTIRLMDDRPVYTNTLNKSETLRVNYTDLFDENWGHYQGWQIMASEHVSVYLKRSKGDVTILLPNNALGTEYVLPRIAGGNERFRVIVYAIQSNTTINVSGNFDQNNGGNSSEGTVTNKHIQTINNNETLVLETSNMMRSILMSNNAVGIFILRFNNVDIGPSCDVLDLVTIQTIPPSSSLGKNFFIAKFDQQSNLTLYVTGTDDTQSQLLVKTDQFQIKYNLTFNETVTLDYHTAKYVMLISTMPVQVYTTTVIVITETQEYIPNDFFMPSSEQYIKCFLTSSCREECPLQAVENSDLFTNISSLQVSFSDANDTMCLNTSSQITMDGNMAIEKVWTSSSYVYYVCETVTGSVFPLGTRLSKLYSACVRELVTINAEGDSIDNDCDGQIDEETLNNNDDDGDSSVDEDVKRTCTQNIDSTSVQTPRLPVNIRRLPRLSDIAIDEDDSSMPLIAVVLSLSVAIFAVFAVISIFMFLELLSRRKQLRNTKIRPFVS